MTQSLKFAELTDAEREKVQRYVQSLIATRPAFNPPVAADAINVDAVYGMCPGLGGEKTTKQMIKEAWDELTAKYDY